MNSKTSSALAKPPRWLSPGRRMSSASGRCETAASAAARGTERVGVAVPPAHRHLHVGQPETPVPPEQADIVDHGLAAALDGENDVVEEHRLHFWVGEDPLVAFGLNAGVSP